MDGAARKSPGEVRFLEEACRTRPADGAARLSLGEALLAADRPEPALAAFEKAVELLAPGAEAAAPKEERFALWLALDGAASCLLRAAKPDRARLHLARARDLAAALGVKEVRGATAYALARCAGEKGEGSVAGTLLAEAIALDPSLRAAAKEDPSFRKVKLNREFKAAVGE
jgi:tetratricopeptide (TPR) repeat protein